jgi:hypothetical protein
MNAGSGLRLCTVRKCDSTTVQKCDAVLFRNVTLYYSKMRLCSAQKCNSVLLRNVMLYCSEL